MKQNIFLGAVADDITGASDLAINLVKGGLRVVQFLCLPTVAQLSDLDCDAVVVALKTRSIPKADAVRQSVAAIEAMRSHGCQRFFFKYCSTFDSTPDGNIGPVTDALMQTLDTDRTILCPAFPEAGRTVYQGHLFVGDRLLNDCGMQHHPLNPMTDADLVRFAGTQSRHPIGLVNFQTVSRGNAAVTDQIEQLVAAGQPVIVTDCCHNEDLKTIAAAVGDFPLTTGGSGIGRFLPAAWRSTGLLDSNAWTAKVPQVSGKSLIIAGSCSSATQRQVATIKDRCDVLQVNVATLMNDPQALMQQVDDLAGASVSSRPIMIYSTASPAEIDKARQHFDQKKISGAIEQFHARAAKHMVQQHGFRRLLIAGGETSGAVVAELGIERLYIGPEICTGVPWTETGGPDNLAITLKSGNFGNDHFFETAIAMLDVA